MTSKQKPKTFDGSGMKWMKNPPPPAKKSPKKSRSKSSSEPNLNFDLSSSYHPTKTVESSGDLVDSQYDKNSY